MDTRWARTWKQDESKPSKTRGTVTTPAFEADYPNDALRTGALAPSPPCRLVHSLHQPQLAALRHESAPHGIIPHVPDALGHLTWTVRGRTNRV